MKFVATLTIAIGLLTASQAMEKPSFHTQGTPTGEPTGKLKPGEYWWHPEISPEGPLMILISIPEQLMHVYRNGILIGRSTVSRDPKVTKRPVAYSRFWISNKPIGRRNTITLRCLTCSGSPGPVSRCTPANSPATPPVTAVFGFRMIFRNCCLP